MVPGRFFRDHKGAINSLDFHPTDDVMVTVERDVERAAALEAAAREELKREEDAQRHQRAPSGGKLGRALTAKLMKDRAKAR